MYTRNVKFRVGEAGQSTGIGDEKRMCLNGECVCGTVRKKISGRLTICPACDGYGYSLAQPKAGAARYYDMLTSLAKVQSRTHVGAEISDSGGELMDALMRGVEGTLI